MEPIRSVPLYFVAMPQSIITVIKPLFVLAPIHIVDGVKSKTQTPRTIKFVNFYEDIFRKVNNVFVNQPLDLGKDDLDPPRPPRYFGLPTVNHDKPPLPPNKPYC
jgi:hypothetical protein